MYMLNPDNPLEIIDRWSISDGAVCGTHHCWAAKLVIVGADTVAVNTPLPLAVSFQDWQDNPLPDENRTIKITVTGPGQPAELTLTPVNGQADFDFASDVSGSFFLRATATFGCDSGELEVVVNG